MSKCTIHPGVYNPDCNACMRDAYSCAVCGDPGHYVHGNRPPLDPPKEEPKQVQAPEEVWLTVDAGGTVFGISNTKEKADKKMLDPGDHVVRYVKAGGQ